MSKKKRVHPLAWVLLGALYVWVAYEWVKLPPISELNPYRGCVELSREYTGKTRSNGRGSTRRETIKRWQCPDGVKIEVTYTH